MNNINQLIVKRLSYLLICLFLIFSSRVVTASTHYLATDGNDSNSGSISSPWATFKHAMSVLRPGDTLIAKAGTYNQKISMINTKSGTAGNPITIQGTLDANGNRLSIIDPFDDVTGWVPAPEIGQGVYKTTSIGYDPQTMVVIINGVPYDLSKLGHPGQPHNKAYFRNWKFWLAQPGNATFSDPDGLPTVNFWDGIEAHYAAVYNGNTAYIKFRNGDDPSTMTIRSARKGASIKIISKSYITIKDFEIRAADNGIQINKFEKGSNSSNIVIDNNKIINGRIKIKINFSNNITIKNNILKMQGYAKRVGNYNFGPWLSGSTYEHGVHHHLYQYYKFPVGGSSTGVDEMGIRVSGTDVKIHDNEIFDTMDAMILGGEDHEIYNNVIHHMSSTGFHFDGRATVGPYSFHDNLLYEVNDTIRIGDFNSGIPSLYVYRNRFWLPPGVGRHIHYHVNVGSGQGQTSTIWWYHNSFSGGAEFSYISEALRNWGINLQGVYFIDNIISAREFEHGTGMITEGPNFIGECSFNWISGRRQANWCDNTNIDNGTALMWGTPTLHNFQLPQGSSAINAGIDISQPFMINGQTYNALPGMTPGYYTGSQPDMGAIQSGTTSDNIAPSAPQRFIIIK